ncbi:hypothetical protein [Hymenobacter glacialis]|uniref:hypothetical protein n=1 Tax=Hymenobacter glacialis TaxID=1908236 RepID=UPI0009F45F36|nr:hypothetical protein [Hymenobacter glacialis]
MPLLTQQGEIYGSLSTNLQGNTALQGAYGLTNHLGAAATFSSMHRKKSRKTENIDFGEASLGYFTKISDNRVLEVYVGGGGGSTERIERNSEQVVTDRFNGSLSKVFTQVNYARKKKDNIRLFNHDFPLTYGAALRMSYVQLNDFRINGLAAPGENNLFFEPITFTRTQIAGPVQLQFLSGQMFGFRNNKYLKAANSVFQVGVIVNIGDGFLSQ